MSFFGLLILLAIIFAVYAVWTQWGATTVGEPITKRFVAALSLAAAAIGAAIMQWLNLAGQ